MLKQDGERRQFENVVKSPETCASRTHRLKPMPTTLLTKRRRGFSQRGREAAFASFPTCSFCAKSLPHLNFPIGGFAAAGLSFREFQSGL